MMTHFFNIEEQTFQQPALGAYYEAGTPLSASHVTTPSSSQQPCAVGSNSLLIYV